VRAPGEYSGLTAKQAELLSFLRYRDAAGHTPSFDEMKVALDLASKSGVHRLLTALEERGYITRTHNRTRAIHVNAKRSDATMVATATIQDLLAEINRRGLRVVLG